MLPPKVDFYALYQGTTCTPGREVSSEHRWPQTVAAVTSHLHTDSFKALSIANRSCQLRQQLLKITKVSVYVGGRLPQSPSVATYQASSVLLYYVPVSILCFSQLNWSRQFLIQPLPLVAGTYTSRLFLTVGYCSYCTNLILQLELNQYYNRFPWTYTPYRSTIYHEIRNQYYIEFIISIPHFCGCLSCRSDSNQHLPPQWLLYTVGTTLELRHYT